MIVVQPPVRHAVADRGGVGIHALLFGPDAGADNRPPLVAIHGVTSTAWSWLGLVGALPGRRVIAVDLRGHGESGWSPDGDYATAGLASDVGALLDALGENRVDVVGASLGGLVGLVLADTRPGLVRSLAMVDLGPSSTQAETDVPPRPVSYPDLAAAITAEQAKSPRLAPAALEQFVVGGYRPAASGVERRVDPRWLVRWPFRREDHWPALRRVTCPVLVVRAATSPVLPADVARAMADAAPSGRCVEIADSGHLVHVDQPAALARELATFGASDEGA